MSVSVLIATYGGSEWEEMALTRAFPSAESQGALQVTAFHDPDGTIASVRNEVARWAKGDWLCFLDADDELAPGYLDAMRRAMEREVDGDLLLTPAVSQIRKGRPREPFFFDRGIPLTDDNWLVVGTLVQRELFLSVGGFSEYEHGFEDFSLWSKCWRVGARVVKVPEAIYCYHVNPQSKHKIGWRDRKWQVAYHQKVVQELNEWEAARA